MDKVILLSNLDGVSIGDVHTYSRALVLRSRGGVSPDAEVLGFLYNSVTPAFSMRIASLNYTIVPTMVRDIPTRGCGILLSRHGQEPLELTANLSTGNDDPINITTWERYVSPEELWATIDRRIVAYWDAPYFLESRQVSIHDARRTVGIERQ